VLFLALDIGENGVNQAVNKIDHLVLNLIVITLSFAIT
jgi:hypothetical protein